MTTNAELRKKIRKLLSEAGFGEEQGQLADKAMSAVQEYVSEIIPEKLELRKDESDSDYFYGLGNNSAIDEIRKAAGIMTKQKLQSGDKG